MIVDSLTRELKTNREVFQKKKKKKKKEKKKRKR